MGLPPEAMEGMSERDRAMMGMGKEGKKERSAGELRLLREDLGHQYDLATEKIVARARYGNEDKAAGDEAARTVEEQRKADREQWVEEMVEGVGPNEKEGDIFQRVRDMEREKPKDADKALKAIDRLWNNIDEALSYRPRNPGESIIDKEWGETVIKVLNELGDQIKFEGSFPERMIDDLGKALKGKREDRYNPRAGQRQWTAGEQWIEPKWKRAVEALRSALLSGGEHYNETPTEEQDRRRVRDEALERYRKGEK